MYIVANGNTTNATIHANSQANKKAKMTRSAKMTLDLTTIPIPRATAIKFLRYSFFKPWKNEYRKNFIAVALGIGIVVKSSVIFADLVILAFLLACELACIVALVVLPFATIYMLFL